MNHAKINEPIDYEMLDKWLEGVLKENDDE